MPISFPSFDEHQALAGRVDALEAADPSTPEDPELRADLDAVAATVQLQGGHLDAHDDELDGHASSLTALTGSMTLHAAALTAHDIELSNLYQTISDLTARVAVLELGDPPPPGGVTIPQLGAGDAEAFWMHLNSTAATDAVIATEAARRRVIVLNSWEGAWIPKIKAANPNCIVLCYKDLSSTRDYAVHGGVDDADLPTGVGYAAANANHPEWFLKNSAGNRQLYSGYAGHWRMDVGVASYQNAWAVNVAQDLAAKGFDGCLADNALFENDAYGNTSPLYPTDESMKLAYLAMLAVVKPVLEAEGLMIIANASNMRTQPGTWDRFMEHLHGGLDEWWLAFGTGSLLPDYSQGWSVQAAEVAANEAAGKLTLVQPHYDASDTASFRYAFASYLAVNNGRTVFSDITQTDGYGNPSPYRPEYDWDLGTPTGPHYEVQTGIFRRDFSGGCVVINARNTGTAAVAVPLGGTYRNEAGSSVTSVSLAGTRGAILRTP